MRTLLCVAAAAIAWLGVPALGGERFAVIIGIDGYQELGKLKVCVADAEGLAKVLAERAGFDPKKIVLLTDNATEPQNKPTYGAMRRRIAQVASLAKKDDTLLVFFSGHGTTRDNEGFLIPIDGDLNNAVSLNWVNEQIEGSAAGTKLLVLDACHAGSAAKGVGGIAPSLTSAVMLLSCAKNQVSYLDEDRGHGIFTGYLIQGLGGAADADKDKDITVGELFTYVEKQMTDWSLATGKTQTPKIAGVKPEVLRIARVSETPIIIRPPEPPKPTLQVYREWPFAAAEARKRQEETAKALGVKTEQEIDLGGGVKLALVLIPAGEFVMGTTEEQVRAVVASDPNCKAEYLANEKPTHQVTIPKPFWLGKYEVTQEQWEAVMGNNPSNFKGAKNPVETVSWNDVQGFLQKLNAGRGAAGFALPTEAQWEYACRSGSEGHFCFGTDWAKLKDYGWYGAFFGGNSEKTTNPVAQKSPNAWGLYDVHGNVWEWCSSPYAKEYDGSEMKGADAQGESRVLRGGSWYLSPWSCRSASRGRARPGDRDGDVGFRVVRLAAGP